MMVLPRPHRDDALIAVSGLAGGLLLWGLGLHSTEGGRPLSGPWTVLVPLLAMSGLELLRRTLPTAALLAGTAVLVADRFTPGSIATVLMFTDLVYAAVVYGPPASARRIPYAAGLITVGATLCSLAWFRDPSALLLGLVVGLVSAGPATSGALVRNHREAAEAARLRANQTALLAELDRREAITAERARMARELHDLVANHLSAIAIHSTAALSLDEPATTRQALTVIRENSVAGLAEMRRLIGLLRDSGDRTRPAVAPTLAGLGALVEQAATSGAASGLKCTLDAAIDADAAPPAPVALAAYRIVQESLTNALKHADAGEVAVRLTGAAGRTLTVTVTSPCGSGAGPRAPGSGAGLVGMRERIALLGGEFEAGAEPGPVGGPERIWRVRAVLPMVDDKEPSS
ncbi:sensor histidine kinase [Streptomyces pacificus]|nr:histidine kinase [Streptomyces pacificus]